MGVVRGGQGPLWRRKGRIVRKGTLEHGLSEYGRHRPVKRPKRCRSDYQGTQSLTGRQPTLRCTVLLYERHRSYRIITWNLASGKRNAKSISQ